MERIILLGRAGVGKTTLSSQLGEMLQVPVICLDAIWQPKWTDAQVPEFRRQIAEAHAGEAWISDGNFAAVTFDLRLPLATLVLWLDETRFTCCLRAVKRVFRKGEPHRMSGLWSFFKFIWNFDTVNRPRIERHLREHGPDAPVRHLKGARDVERFLAEVREARGRGTA